MQYKLTARQMQIEEEIDFKMRLADVYKGFAENCPDSTVKEFYSNTAHELCNEAHALCLEHQKIREECNKIISDWESDLLTQQFLT